MKIDSHQHFWKYDPVHYDWIDKSMAKIRRDFLPQDLLPELQKNDISGCIAVQAQETVKETEFLIELSQQNPWIKGAVGWIDLESQELEKHLEILRENRALVGFRKVLQGLPPEVMENPAFINGISLLEKFGFTYDILIFPHHLDHALKLAKKFPNQKFVIDHLAKPNIKNADFGPWMKKIMDFGELENVYCKVSGMVTEADWKFWKPSDFHPYLEKVTETFGTDRLMYGSDWPVCLVAASYSEVHDIAQVFFSSFSESEKEKVFGKNAALFYDI